MSFADFPVELLVEQLVHLPVEEILKSCNTNSLFAFACQNPLLWKRLLERDFPELANLTKSGHRQVYLKFLQERALDELIDKMNKMLPFTVGDTSEGQYRFLQEMVNTEDEDEEERSKYQEALNVMGAPISGLHQLTIYYPVWDYLHPVTYQTNGSITPANVLDSISQFYRQPYTQENDDAISDILGRPRQEILPDMLVVDMLGGSVYMETIKRHEDGITFNFGS